MFFNPTHGIFELRNEQNFSQVEKDLEYIFPTHKINAIWKISWEIRKENSFILEIKEKYRQATIFQVEL